MPINPLTRAVASGDLAVFLYIQRCEATAAPGAATASALFMSAGSEDALKVFHGYNGRRSLLARCL